MTAFGCSLWLQTTKHHNILKSVFLLGALFVCVVTSDHNGNRRDRPCDLIEAEHSDNIEGICVDDEDRCEVDIDVSANPLSQTSCNKVCEEAGLICTRAWDGVFWTFNDECDRGDRTDCDDNQNELTCRCEHEEEPDTPETPTVSTVIEDPPTVVEDPPTVIEDPPTVVEDPVTVVEDPVTAVEDSPAITSGTGQHSVGITEQGFVKSLLTVNDDFRGSWEDGFTACEVVGGSLPIIQSDRENSLVFDLCENGCFIGLKAVEDTLKTDPRSWQWIDGSYLLTDDTKDIAVDYWHQGEPNGDLDEDRCAFVNSDEWRSVECNTVKERINLICQFSETIDTDPSEGEIAVEEIPVEEVVEEIPVEDGEDTVDEEVVDEVAIEEIVEVVEDVAVEEVADEIAEEIVEDVVAEEVEDVVVEEVFEDVVVEEIVEDVVVEEVIEDVVVEEVIEDVVVEEIVEDIVVEEIVEDVVVEEIVEDVVVEEIVEDVVEEIVEDVVVEEIVEDVVVEEAVGDVVAEELVEDVVAEELVEDIVAEEAIEDVVEEIVEDVMVEEIVEDVVVEEVAEEVADEVAEEVADEDVPVVVEEEPAVSVDEAGISDVCHLLDDSVISAVCEFDETFCEIDVSAAGFLGFLGEISCNEVCQQAGLVCSDAWEGPYPLSKLIQERCVRGDEISCEDVQQELTCRCEIPSLPTPQNPDCGCHPTDKTPETPIGLCDRDNEDECLTIPDVKFCTWTQCEEVCDGNGYDCCSEEKPCDYGEGDCDSDFECIEGLICGDNNCHELHGDRVEFVDTDCCILPIFDSLM